MTQKKMYKVLHPQDKKSGGTYWMRIGSAFTNRDDSLNVVLDVMPPQSLKSGRFEMQIRELDAEDLRRRESYANGSRDLGGIGGGPNLDRPLGGFDSRAVTAREPDDKGVPF